MRRRRTSVVIKGAALLAVVVAAVSGCAEEVDPVSIGMGTTTTTTTTVPEGTDDGGTDDGGTDDGGTDDGGTDLDEGRSLSVSAGCVVDDEDLEGAFDSPDQMGDYLECVIPAAYDWLFSVYSDMPPPEDIMYIPEGVVLDTTCLEMTDVDLAYCTGDNTIYLGEVAVWHLYSEFGDAAPVVVVAHEMTHHFQNILEMPQAQTPNEQIRYENQADCGAGAFIAYADAQGYLDYPDDITDLAGALAAAGEMESDTQSHGTMEERLGSFDLAYLSGLDQPMFACVEFVPEVPIIQ